MVLDSSGNLIEQLLQVDLNMTIFLLQEKYS